MAYDIFQLVLDFQQDPSHFSALIGPDKPLPDDLGKLLEEVAAMETSGQDGSQREELVSATAFFVERVLFVPGGDFYRHLGVDRHATQDQIRKHYHLLMHLFMLDREDMAEDWSAEFADCINRAYSILRDPAKRRKYDIHLAGQSPHASRAAPAEDGGNSFARSIVSFAKARNNSQPERKNHKAGDSAGEPLLHQGTVSGAAASENLAMNSAVAPIQEEESFIADSIERAYSDIGARISSANDTPPEAGGSAEAERLDDYALGGVAPVLVDDDLGSGVEAAYHRRSRSSNTSSRWGFILVLLLAISGGIAAIYEYQIAPGQLSAFFSQESRTDVANKKQEAEHVAMPESVVAQEETSSTSIEKGMLEPSPQAVAEQPQDNPDETVESALEQKMEAETVHEPETPRPIIVENSSDVVKQKDEPTPVTTGLTLSPRHLPQVPQSPAPAPVQKKVEARPAKPVAPVVQKVEKARPDNGRADVSSATAVPVPSAEPAFRLAPDSATSTVSVAPSVTAHDAIPVTTTQQPSLPLAGDMNEEETEAVAGLTTSLPHPPPPMEPPQVMLIQQEALDGMMRVFVRSYEEGDLQGLLSVFAKNAHTNDRTDRDGIAKDYRELFDITEKRQFIIDDLTWEPIDGEHARGEGAFEVKVLLKGETSITTVRGQVRIDVEKRGRDLLITRFFHSYE